MARSAYVREQLGIVAESLSDSAAPIQRRLEVAALAMQSLTLDDFRDEGDRRLFDRIRKALTARQPGEDQGLRVFTQAMSDEEAGSVARDIGELHGRFAPVKP